MRSPPRPVEWCAYGSFGHLECRVRHAQARTYEPRLSGSRTERPALAAIAKCMNKLPMSWADFPAPRLSSQDNAGVRCSLRTPDHLVLPRCPISSRAARGNVSILRILIDKSPASRTRHRKPVTTVFQGVSAAHRIGRNHWFGHARRFKSDRGTPSRYEGNTTQSACAIIGRTSSVVPR